MRILLFMCVLLLSGCSATWHIQRAQKKGALIEKDSIKGKLFLKGHKGLGTGTTDLADLFSKPIPVVTKWKADPMTGEPIADTETEASLNYDTATNTVTIYVPVECPDTEAEYTTQINTEVDCPPLKGVKKFWVVVYVVGACIVGLIIGVIIGKLLG